jgi:hypothetical protein
MRKAAMEDAMQEASLEKALIEHEINEVTAQDAAEELAMAAEEARLDLETSEAAMGDTEPEDEADSQFGER